MLSQKLTIEEVLSHHLLNGSHNVHKRHSQFVAIRSWKSYDPDRIDPKCPGLIKPMPPSKTSRTLLEKVRS